MHRLERQARWGAGYVTRRDVLDAGYSDAELARAVDEHTWTTVRRGVYAPADWYATLTARDKHLLLVRSVIAPLDPECVVTHDSAVVVHGLGDYGHGTYELDLDVAHVARLGGTTSRRTASVQHHRAPVDPAEVTTVNGMRVRDDVSAVVETMTTLDLEPACVLASSWLAEQRQRAQRHHTPFAEEDAKAVLLARLESSGPRPGGRVARDAITIADARCQSVAEVRFLVLCWEFGLPRPEPQAVFALAGGGRAEVDFFWTVEGLVVEVDGMLKYADPPVDEAGGRRTSAQDRVKAEKRRERALRDLGLHVVRVTWADLAPANRARTAEFVRRELERAARMRAR